MADSNNSSLEVNILDENFEKFNYYFDFPQSVEKGYIEILENEINLFFPIMDLVEHSKYSLNQRVLLFINGQLLFSYDWLPIYTNNDLIKIKEMLTKCYYVFSDKIKNQTENIDYTPIFYDEKEMSYSTNSFKFNDLIKIKEMLTKCYYVFSDKIKNQTENIDYTPIFYDEKEMSYSTNSFKFNDLIKIKEMLTKCYYVFSDKIKNQTENIDYTPIFYDEKEMSYSTNSFKLYCFENRFVTSLEINITSPESPPPPDKTCHIKFYLGPNLIFCSQRDLASLSSKDFSYILSLILHKIIK